LKLAYLIRAHHRPSQLARLVQRLGHDDVSFFIHVSARTSAETYGAMRTGLRDAANVHWLPRVKTYYGGFSLVQSVLIGLDRIARTNPLPDHTIVLSGQDYPLKSPAELDRFFAEHSGKSLVHHFALPSREEWQGENGGLDRIRYWHFERLNYRTRQLRIPFIKRRFPRGVRPYGGSAWFAATADCLQYVVTFVERNERFVRFFKHALMPDELMIPTIVLNSPLRDAVVNEPLHYIEWPGGAHPNTFGKQDFPKLAASDRPFARKFDVHYDAEILDMLDREVLHAA
jgi:Core-2/I-Branching enzyme